MNEKRRYLLPAIFAGICVVAIIVSTAIAAHYVGNHEWSSLKDILLTDPAGTVHRIDPDTQEDLAELLLNLKNSSSEEYGISVPDHAEIYSLQFQYTDRTETLSLCGFIRDDTLNVLLLTGDGKLFQPDRTAQNSFLTTSYAVFLYPDARIPSLMTKTEEIVTPNEISWYYKDVTGRYVERSDAVTTEKTLTYSQNGQIGFSFDIAPDETRIILRNTETILYDGPIEELAVTDLYDSGAIRVELYVKWDQKEGTPYYGSARYIFSLDYYAPAVFTPTGSAVSAGGPFFIRCENIRDTSRIKSRILSGITGTIHFYSYGGTTYGVLLVPADAKPGEVTVRCSYSGITTELSFTVNAVSGSPEEVSYQSDPSKVLTNHSASALARFETLFQSVSKQDAEYAFLSEAFLPPVSGSPIIRFGDRVTVNASGTPFTSDYVEYQVALGTSVQSMNGGTVCATGYDAYLGNYVVISHGCGIQTWYGHLSGINVKAGDTVARGETIGTAGSSGFASGESVVLFASVNGQKTDPAVLQNSGNPILQKKQAAPAS